MNVCVCGNTFDGEFCDNCGVRKESIKLSEFDFNSWWGYKNLIGRFKSDNCLSCNLNIEKNGEVKLEFNYNNENIILNGKFERDKAFYINFNNIKCNIKLEDDYIIFLFNDNKYSIKEFIFKRYYDTSKKYKVFGIDDKDLEYTPGKLVEFNVMFVSDCDTYVTSNNVNIKCDNDLYSFIMPDEDVYINIKRVNNMTNSKNSIFSSFDPIKNPNPFFNSMMNYNMSNFNNSVNNNEIDNNDELENVTCSV